MKGKGVRGGQLKSACMIYISHSVRGIHFNRILIRDLERMFALMIMVKL